MLDGKPDFDRALGDRIREARENVGVTQDQLARAVALSRTSITNIEKGRQGVQAFLLVRIAQTLGRPVTDLIPGAASRSSDPLPQKVKNMEPQARQWAERVLGSAAEDDDHAA